MRAWGIAAVLALGAACSQKSSVTGNVEPINTVDSGPPDSGPPDSGPPDAGDGGTPDSGTPDAGPQFGGPGPWPLTDKVYGAADGIMEMPVVGTTTDETQNLWVATHDALYLLAPGQKTFTRYTGKDGLHNYDNQTRTCDTWNGHDPYDPCIKDGGRLVGAWAPGIIEIVGGGANEVFVGYQGYHEYNEKLLDPAKDGTWEDPYRYTGQLDRVRLQKDGKIEVVRFQMVSGVSAEFWHNRNVLKMVYDHFKHPHELYAGTDHGVTKFSPDKWHPQNTNTGDNNENWFNSDTNNRSWMSDHLHPQTCYHKPCGKGEDGLRLGDWRGLAVNENGDLWVAGRWAAGLIRYVPENQKWYQTTPPFREAFITAMGDDYLGNCSGNRPVFCPPLEGDTVDLSAVTVDKDGVVWFSSGIVYSDKDSRNYGVASYNPKAWHFDYYDPVRDIGMAEDNVKDMLALPDGRLVLAAPNTGLTIWDPKTRKHTPLRQGSGLPDDHIQRIELDTMVNPPALHVSTWGGAVVIRQIP